MMNFERNGKAKESMGIGLTGEALEIYSVKGELDIQWARKNGGHRSREYKLKKRWFIPLKWIIESVMTVESVSVWKMRLLFKAKSQENDWMETFWQFVVPWICISRRTKKMQKSQEYAEIDLNNMRVKTHNDRGDNRSKISFTVVSSDMEKLSKIQEMDKPLKRVIYKDKIYEINPESKTIR